MATSNRSITMNGEPLKISGSSIAVGSQLPNVTLSAADLSDVALAKYVGKPVIVMSVPSLDTPVCSLEVSRFNREALALNDTVVVVVSRDLPFAQKRWCGAEGTTDVVTLSDYKYRTFGEAFGVEWLDSALLARAVFVADRSGKITFVDYVGDIASEPDYGLVLEAAKLASK